jgi:16S rRNA pseudouridine516 synthase
VDSLHRESVGDYALPADLPPGSWRWLGSDDLDRLEQYPKNRS